MAEIVFRQFFPIDSGTSVEHRVPHPVLGWILEANASYLNRMAEATVRVSYNSDGWRDVQHSIENAENSFRVLVLGDSYMEGYSVGLEDVFHRRLMRLANDQGMNLEVINLGVGGYGTLQELLAFQNIGARYKPDLVLLGLYLANDVRNNSLELESAVNGESMKVATRPFLSPAAAAEWEITRVDYAGARRRYENAKSQSESFWHRMLANSAVLQALAKAKYQHKKSREVDVSKQGKQPAVEPAAAEEERRRNFAFFGVNFCQEYPEFTRAWESTKLILERLKQDTTNAGAEFFVFTVPSLSDVHPETIGETAEADLLCLAEPPSYARAIGILSELEIEHLNLLPTFRQEAANKNVSLFRMTDRHWNELGHELAAETVYQTLLAQDALPNPRPQ